MFSFFNKAKKSSKSKIAGSKTKDTGRPVKKGTLTLVPGSMGEHSLQEKYGTRTRALKFYDKQVLNYLSPIMQEFIAKQEVMFIATADSHGECDCSARFGLPGFVRVINKNYLIYPEYRGNGVLASQGNIIENPHIGLIFVDFFETTVGLHVNGAARLVDNDRLLDVINELPVDIIAEMQLQGNKCPERWIMIEVEEAYIHCSKHVPLLKKLDKQIDWGTDNMVAKGGDFFQLENLSLYNRIGGEQAIKKVVDVLYRKIMVDSELRNAFDDIPITDQIERHSAFLSFLFGNPQVAISKDDAREAYIQLLAADLSDNHFEQLINHLHSSLSELDVPTTDIDAMMDLLRSPRSVATTT